MLLKFWRPPITPRGPYTSEDAARATAEVGTMNRTTIGVGDGGRGLIIRITISAQDNRTSVLLIK